MPQLPETLAALGDTSIAERDGVVYLAWEFDKGFKAF